MTRPVAHAAHSTFDDLSFAPPPGWREQKVVAFIAPASDPTRGVANVTIAQERRIGGENLKTHVHRHLVAMATAYPSYELHDMIDIQVAGRPAIRVRGGWPSAAGRVEQVSVHITPAILDGEVLTLTATAQGPADREADDALEGILATARWAGSTRNDPAPLASWDRPDKVWR